MSCEIAPRRGKLTRHEPERPPGCASGQTLTVFPTPWRFTAVDQDSKDHKTITFYDEDSHQATALSPLAVTFIDTFFD